MSDGSVRGVAVAFAAIGIAAAFASCAMGEAKREGKAASAAAQGRLTARPDAPPSEAASARTGIQKLGLGARRDAVLFVPSSYRGDRAMPLVVMLHGAGGEARGTLRMMEELAEKRGFLVLAPDSRGDTWDVIVESAYGPDVAFLDQALQWTFARYAVDAKRIAVGGFSDGASYALSIGVMNGDLFSSILAFSPGFLAPKSQHGLPRIYISHGTRDQVLPIDRCSRRIVPLIRNAGLDVTYREFDGPHTVPEASRREAVELFLGG